ncbi:hypothetical protein BD779DRAFT_1610703 [Infundibulicybe gibba]|nr:hypothetical protein BD779DRAFT_1610703 [Infundibulicybe gibba]
MSWVRFGARTGHLPLDILLPDLSALEWHSLPAAELCVRLGVSQTSGLDAPMAARRLARAGKMSSVLRPGILQRKYFGFGGLLFVASIICFVAWRPLGDPNPSAANLALAVVLLIVIGIQAVFNAWQDYSTSRVMASISGMLPSDILVTRDGSTSKIPASDLVSGDIVTITLGSKVPADIRLIEISSDLRFDRSILTGESNAVPASLDCTDNNFMESRNIALQGTLCTNGNGKGICVALGDNTVFGRIAKQAALERPTRTTLEIEILRFVLIIASLAITVAIIIVVLWSAWLRRDHPAFISVPTLLVDCVSVAVAFIPEGLPVCVTLSLTVIARAMRKSNILCKSLATNKMTVANISIGTAQFPIEKLADDAPTTEALAAMSGLCNDASFESSDTHLAPEKRTVHGDATDSALLRFSESITPVANLKSMWIEMGKIAFNSKNKFNVKIFRSGQPDSNPAPCPILPSDNYMPSDLLLLAKGAPDILSRRCTHYVDFDGVTHELDPEALANITRIQESFASQGQRVLLVAKRIVPLSDFSKDVDGSQIEDLLMNLNVGLTIAGLVALVDPPRHDTAETVRVCRRAGVRVAMVTGDFALTATAIARQVGIITTPPQELRHLSDLPADLPMDTVAQYDRGKDHLDPMTSLVLSGQEMMTMTESQWKQVLAFDEIIFARTSPMQKLQIVRAFQGDGCTVAVTGDGPVNDAPALKQADVGIAVAGSSEVAMEAADLILLSDFSAMITGIRYGRLCFENLRKSILYLLPAGSFSELMPVVFNVLTGVPQALSSIQMILICVMTDVLPALSMVYEKPEADLLLQKPRNRKKDRLAGIRLLFHAYFFLGILESLTAMTGAFYFGFQRNGVPFSALWLKYGGTDIDPDRLAELTNKAQSIYFFNLVIMQWFNLLATRTRRLSLFQQNPFGRPETRNLLLFPAMLMALAIGCFFSYVPWFQKIFLTRGIKAEYFFLPMAYGLVILFMDEMRKLWNRRHPKSFLAKIAW